MSQDYTDGQRLGDYEILGVLGAGGMGKVYKVRNIISDRVEAMKILLPNLASEKELADRFLREIKLLATLHHPNIASLRTALTLDNQLVMIMEYVDGVTLSSRLQQGPISAGETVKYVDQVLNALSYAHQLGIVHRDIKPGNMMLTSDGTVKLMDFGIARSGTDRSLTTSGTTLGSLNYMAPEQIKGDPTDARSDIYSLGVSMYEMVTGMLPFEAASSFSMMSAHVEQIPKAPIVHKPGLPESLNQIIMMALAKDPANRFQSADAFRAALGSVDAKALAATPSGTTMPAAWTPPYNASSTDETLAVSGPIMESSPASALPGVSSAAAGAWAAAGQPTVADAPPPSIAAASGKRGLYMALGALVIVGVLFGAGIYLPRRAKTHAGEGQVTVPAPQTVGQQQPQIPPAPEPALPPKADNAPATPEAQPAATPPPQPEKRETKAASEPAQPSRRNASNSEPRKSPAAAVQQESAAAQQAAAAEQAEAAASAKELEEAEHQEEQLTSRAQAVSQTLDFMKKQQSSQGYGLRGDVVSAEQRMQTYMSKAQAALQRQDGAAAKKYFDQADREVAFLEKFLGR
jgi:serine/threonine-protein kinase